MKPAERFAVPAVSSWIEIVERPLLASWERKSHPDQVALGTYLAAVDQVLPRPVSAPPWVLGLRVGLPEHQPLDSGGRDLDNFMEPLANYIGWVSLCSVWGWKRRGTSMVALTSRREAEHCPPVGGHVALTVPAGLSTMAWKERVAEALPAKVIAVGPVEVEMSWTVSPSRNWVDLWKRSIDGLEPILGRAPGARPLCPRDDRITVLGLHRTLHADIGWDVGMEIWWSTGLDGRPVLPGR